MNPYGGSVRAWFDGVPAAPVLSVTGPCGTAVAETSIRACPPSSPPIDIGQAYGRAAAGQSQRWLLLLAPEVTQWFALAEHGTFTPATGARSASGEIETVYTPARAGEATLRFLADDACGIRGYQTTQTVWNCAEPLIQSFTSGQMTLAVGQSTFVSYVTQERHSEVGSVTSSLGNALGGPVHSPPETRHTYTATKAGADIVTMTVQTPCGAATATLEITVR